MNKEQEQCVKTIQDALNTFKDVDPLPPKMTLPFGFYDFGLVYDNNWKRLRDFEQFLLVSQFGDDSKLWKVIGVAKDGYDRDDSSLQVQFRELAPKKPLGNRTLLSVNFSASRHEHFYQMRGDE